MDGFGDECELRKNIETRESRFSRESSPTARGRLDFYRGPPMEQQAPLISGEKTLDYSLVRSSWNFDATPPSTRPIVARSLTKGSIRRERSESLPLWWKFHFTPTFAIFSSFFFFSRGKFHSSRWEKSDSLQADFHDVVPLFFFGLSSSDNRF